MTAYREYSRRLYDVLEDMFQTQGEKIEQVADWMAESIAAGGVVHLFGSGHSHMVAEEVFHRAGSLMPLNPMLDVNPVPIGAVLEAKARGARTVGITSDRHYAEAPSRHESGKRLADVADITLDTCVPWGDALVEIEGAEQPVGGVSSVAGLALINAVVVETTARLLEKGIDPPVIPTMNLPGGDEKMERLVEMYGKRLPLLRNA